MIKIKSIRRGFANNSSSSHSIIFVTEEKFNEVREESAGYSFGWDDFTLKSRVEKEKYLFVNLVSSLRNHIEIKADFLDYDIINSIKKNAIVFCIEQNKKKLPFKNLEVLLEVFKIAESFDMYVDHESVFSIPVDEQGILNLDFYGDFCKEILDKNYLILGGNDNSDSHPLKSLNIGVAEIVNMIR